MTAILDNMNFCRVCESTVNLEEIFEEQNKEILRMLRSIAPSAIKLNDGLPKCICTGCTHKLIDIFSFKSLYEFTYNKLKKNYQSNARISLECKQDLTGLESFIDEEVDENLVESKISIKKEYVEHPPDETEETEANQALETTEAQKEHFSCQQRGKSHIRVFALNNPIQSLNLQQHICAECGKLCFKSESLCNCEEIEPSRNVPTNQLCRDSLTNDPSEGLQSQNESKLYKCLLCGKGFDNSRYFRNHQMWHKNPDRYTCKQCGKAFTRLPALEAHKKLHLNPTIYKCEKCGKVFKNNYRWREHQLIHSYPQAYSCDECGKSYTSKRNLEQHQSLHSNPDLYRCDVCGICCSLYVTYKRHRRRHLKTSAH